MKRIIKQLVGSILLMFLSILIQRHKGQTLILSYHRILPRTHPEYNDMQAGMVVSDKVFRNHMKWLTKYFNVIRLIELNKQNSQVQLPKCVITMDDGWVDNFTYAYPILSELNIPATIFLVSNMVNTDNYFWPEKLGLLLRNKSTRLLLEKKIKATYSAEPSDYEALVELLKSKSDENIIKVLSEVEKEAEVLGLSVERNRQILNQEELAIMAVSGLVEYGSHTANHIRLDKVSLPQAISEITDSKEQLELLLKSDVATFCYPNGSYTSEVVEEVSKIYELACTTDKGWSNDTSSKHQLKRIMLHDDISNTKSLFWGRVLGFF